MLKSIKRFLQFLLNQRVIPPLIVFFLCFMFLTACGGTKTVLTNTDQTAIRPLNKKNNHFIGILVVDPVSKDTLINKNADTYFTPASNTKIFTLYSALKLLPEKLPALKYMTRNDTLFVEGTGDPTFLHPFFNNNSTSDFLKEHRNIAINLNNYQGDRYGPGWAWEDFDTYFSPELGPLPLFGNVLTVIQTDSLSVLPRHFKERVYMGKQKKRRAEFSNDFFVPYTTDTLQIPYLTSKATTVALLEKEIGKSITLVNNLPSIDKKTLPGITSDTLYKKMMLESDNFLAEQIMLLVSSELSDTLSFETAKNYVLENELSDLKHEPRWVDGSGLSRYNLFTPASFVNVLNKIYKEVPEERIFMLFPRWDENGTMNPSEGQNSYIFAKSGALGNNYNLSGYLITKSGKLLLFSYMNNHFRVPTSEIRATIKSTLNQLHETN